MATAFGAWRATYTPGNWLVLSGPTTLVIMQPAPAQASMFVNQVWDGVVSAASIAQVASKLTSFGLDAMPTLAVLFWDDEQLHTLLRGDIAVEDAESGAVLATGQGAHTWRETTLASRVVRVGLEQVNPDGLLQLPMVVGVVMASVVVLDATGHLPNWPDGSVAEPFVAAVAPPTLAADVTSGVEAAPAVEVTPSEQVPDVESAQPELGAPNEPDQAVPDAAVSAQPAESAATAELSWSRGAQVVTSGAVVSAALSSPVVSPSPAPASAGTMSAELPVTPEPATPEPGTQHSQADEQFAQQPLAGPPAESPVEQQSDLSVESPADTGLSLFAQHAEQSATTDAVPSSPVAEEAELEQARERPNAFMYEPTQMLPNNAPWAPDQSPQPGFEPPATVEPIPEPSLPLHAEDLPAESAQANPGQPVLSGLDDAPAAPLLAPPTTARFDPLAPIDADASGQITSGATLVNGTAALAENDQAESGVQLVTAVFCAAGHPNPPSATSCRWCGQAINVADLRQVPMPVLASIDIAGDKIPLTSALLVGRAPVADPSDPTAQLFRVLSPNHDISRTHCRIAQHGWDVEVTDLDSTNGTVVIDPGQQPVRLAPNQPFVVQLGAIVDLGDGQLLRVELP